jgi:retinoid hydroxylase
MSLPLPPGRSGLPFLGELPKILEDAYGFVEARTQQHGPIFRTSILGRPAAVITGPDASGKFIDEADIQRAGAMPAHVQTLFGGPGVLPLLDGPAHRTRKQLIMAAFTHEAIASYLPKLERLVAGAFGRWSGAELKWVPELKRLAVEGICTTVVGLSDASTIAGVVDDYNRIIAGFSALPVPLPGSAYARAKVALRRVLGVFARAVEERRARPADDGLSRMLAARVGDAALDTDAAARELHHVVIAGLIVWAWLMTAARELAANAPVRERLQKELDAAPGPLTPARLAQLRYLLQVANEVRRVTPVVQVFFGLARRTFTFAGHEVPEGWMVLWGIRSSHIRPEVYPDPFSPGRAEHEKHPHAFVPNGAGDALQGHKCAGYELAPMLLEVFIVELLRHWTWSFPSDQDFTPDFRQVPPPPKDGLRVRLARRVG